MTGRLGPRPVPGPDDAPYWQALEDGVLVLQLCTACEAVRHPPQPRCQRCASADYQWMPTDGLGTVYSFTIVRYPAHQDLVDLVPYVVALIELDEGPRVVSNVVDVDPDHLAVGQRVQVRFDLVEPGVVLPRFTLVEPETSR